VPHISVTVNGVRHDDDVEPRQLLVYYLRETLGLTGTNVGCDTSTCGSCTVLLDGKSVKSCTLLAMQSDGREVTTIECGYCTPGMIMAADSLIREHPEGLDEDAVRWGLKGNLCRCTGYQNIVSAVLAASKEMSGAPASAAASSGGDA